MNILQDKIFEAARKPHDQKAFSHGISYVNLLLVKYKDDRARSPIEIKSTINQKMN
jgi:hypothetical protein